MKRLFTALSFFLVILLIPANFAGAASNEEGDTISINLDEENLNSISLDTIKSHISKPGNTLILEANEIDKLEVYNNILEPLKIPLFLEDNEFVQANPDAEPSKEETSIDGWENVTVETKTTLIALYNAHGKITVLQNDQPINKEAEKAKTFRTYTTTDSIESFIEDFKNDMDKIIPSQEVAPLAVQEGELLTSIRKSFSVDGSYVAIGGTTVKYIAGKAVTDYILYANGTGTHFYVLADSQVSPAGVADTNNSVYTSGYKSNIRTNSTTNSLISWTPNTSNLNLNTSSSYQVGVSVAGTGISLNFGYTWSGKSSTSLQGLGDKTSGLTTSFYSREGNVLTGYGLASSKFTTGHGALIKASNKVLSFSSSHQFRNSNLQSAGGTWYSTTATNLSYSYN
ncbi:hypothetical protein [Paenibacillus sp. Marseille-Q4541]|uniref:hypothetical protein n=1 Tax=Paenibacillus sp. Marseille-Q4541 TaxID=2831522 RepID=UPI001BA4F424|nr:hypothetical protein [Paenibacillus sp. Marseille-Q4541]